LERDADQLDHTLHRQYSSSFGRWMSPDPGGVKVVNMDTPQTWNMYAYATDNPTTLNDPSGLQSAGGGADCTNIGETTTVFSYNIAFNHTVTNVNETDWMNCAGDGDGFWFLHPSGPIFGAPDTSYQYRNLNAMYVAAQTLIPRWMLESRVYVSTLGQNFLDEFKQGGCVNQFLNEAADPDPSRAEDVVRSGGENAAAFYMMTKGLTVPLRSSVYRGMLDLTETSAGAVAIAPVDYSLTKAFINEMRSLAAGACQ